MTISNKLTLSRIILTPFFCLFFYILNVSTGNYNYLLAVLCLILYVYMELSDVLDGLLARKRGEVTDLGKVFDPFSDCLMHLSFFAIFTIFSHMSFLAFMLILWRELLINLMRMLLMKSSVVLPANIFGKFKTVFYAILSFVIIMYVIIKPFINLSSVIESKIHSIFYILSHMAAFFSVLSFMIYFVSVLKNNALSSISK